MKQLRDWAGRKLTFRPGSAERQGEPRDGVRILTPEDYDMVEKSPRTTKYTLNGLRYRIKQGDPIPEGAVLDEERAEERAPENRAEKEAPENRSARKRAKKDD